MRKFPRVAAAVAMMSNHEERHKACASLPLPKVHESHGVAALRPDFEVGIVAHCRAPLTHGSDTKAGNATLFRRQPVITDSGAVLELPFYAGNAIRGQLRDLLADHFLFAMGLKPCRVKPPVETWFFHILYGGGALEDGGAAGKAMAKMGSAGALKTDAMREWRQMLPLVSLLGTGMSNRVLAGRVKCGDLRPDCREWGTGTVPVDELFTVEFLTRREDLESYEDHSGMIATSECLRPGTVLRGGMDFDACATPIERGALARGLLELKEHGFIGAQSNKGHGQVEIEYANLPDPAPYDDYLAANRETILDYLENLGAIHARSEFDFGSSAPSVEGEEQFL